MEIKIKPEQPLDKTTKKLTVKEIMINNFIGGIFWALGATIGISLLFALLTLIAKHINFVPIVGSFVSNILTFVLQNNQTLTK
jgi:Domain of unknown function (DUF5665)